LRTILAEECRAASEHSQLMVTTHSPYFVDGLSPKEVWILSRDQSGYTQAKRVDSIPGINKFMDAEALLGDLWMEGFFAEKSSKRNPSL
jgi:predicted ATPase